MPNVGKSAIVGLGNIFMGDDGVGVRAVERIEQIGVPERTLVIDMGTRSLDSMDIIVDSERVVVIDAVKGGSDPGTLYRLRPADLASGRYEQLSLHQVSLLESLELARLKGRIAPDVIIIGIEPKSIRPGRELSPEVRARLTDVARAAIEEAVA